LKGDTTLRVAAWHGPEHVTPEFVPVFRGVHPGKMLTQESSAWLDDLIHEATTLLRRSTVGVRFFDLHDVNGLLSLPPRPDQHTLARRVVPIVEQSLHRGYRKADRCRGR